MPTVNSPTAIDFANKARQFRDLQAQLYETGRRLKEIWDAGALSNPTLAALLPDDATYLIGDGAGTAAGDARTPITAADVRRCLDTQFKLQNFQERGVLDQSLGVTNAERDLCNKAAVNGQPKF